MARHRRESSPLRPALVAAFVTVLLLTLGSTGTFSGWPAAQIANGANGTKSGTLAITHSYGSTTCVGAAGQSSVSCTGAFQPMSSTTTSTDMITNNSAAASGTVYNEQIKADGCGLVQLANSVNSDADPMLPRYGMSFQQIDKWGTTSAVGFDGSTGYATDVSQTNLSQALIGGQAALSVGVWFRASAGSHGGGLLSLSANGNASGTAGANPVIWMDTSGKVHFGAVFTAILGLLGGKQQVAGTADLRDGQWHFASLTISTASLIGIGLSATMTGYIDGNSVGNTSGLGALSTTSNAGYWHLGWADLSGWTPAGGPYFDGALSGAYYLAGVTQSSTTLKTLASTTSASGYASALGSPTALWMLGDDGTTATTYSPAYTATPGGTTWLPAQPLCGTVNVTLKFGATTAYSGSLSNFPSSWLPATPATGPSPNGGTQSLTTQTSAGTNYAAVEAGLHLYAPLSVKIWPSTSTQWIQTFTWSGSPTNVFIA